MLYYKRKAAARKFSRKPRRKIYRKRNPGTLVYKGQPGIADRSLIKMKYRDHYIVTASSPAYQAQYAWRLNSIYDPDRTGGGHQPLTYDQWSLFYQAYRVYKVTIEIDLVNNGNNALQCLWTVQPDDAVLAYTNASFEQPHTYSVILGGAQGQNRSKLKRTMYLPRYLGQTPQQYKSNENTYALFGSNPNTSIYGILMAESIDGVAPPNLAVNCNLVFHVELFDRKEITISQPAQPVTE